jgi:hypothetical protein
MQCSGVSVYLGSLSTSASSEQITYPVNNNHRSYTILLAHNLLKSGAGK